MTAIKKKVVKKKVAKKKAAARPAETKPAGGYRVTVKSDGFRRAGRPWSGSTEVAAGELTNAQVEQLKSDPMFKVEAL